MPAFVRSFSFAVTAGNMDKDLLRIRVLFRFLKNETRVFSAGASAIAVAKCGRPHDRRFCNFKAKHSFLVGDLDFIFYRKVTHNAALPNTEDFPFSFRERPDESPAANPHLAV
ncbi:MAG: hypothetical protein U1F16_17990 [Turneriella sp.]